MSWTWLLVLSSARRSPRSSHRSSDDLINPLIGIFVGGIDFSALSFGLGDAQFMYGNFINAVIKFLIVAWVVFLLVKMVNRVTSLAEKPEDVAPEVDAGPSEKDILIEIRDALRKA